MPSEKVLATEPSESTRLITYERPSLRDPRAPVLEALLDNLEAEETDDVQDESERVADDKEDDDDDQDNGLAGLLGLQCG